MRRYVTDTQCLLWHLNRDRHLPKGARSIFEAADKGHAQVLVPSMVLVESVFLLQRQRVAQAVVEKLLQLPEDADASFCVVSLDLSVARASADFGPAAVPELADRIIAATARALNLPLLTVDHAIAASGLVEMVES